MILTKSDTLKSQLTVSINLISCKDDNDEEHVMHSKSDNIDILMNDEADEVIEVLNFLNHSKKKKIPKIIQKN